MEAAGSALGVVSDNLGARIAPIRGSDGCSPGLPERCQLVAGKRMGATARGLQMAAAITRPECEEGANCRTGAAGLTGCDIGLRREDGACVRVLHVAAAITGPPGKVRAATGTGAASLTGACVRFRRELQIWRTRSLQKSAALGAGCCSWCCDACTGSLDGIEHQHVAEIIKEHTWSDASPREHERCTLLRAGLVGNSTVCAASSCAVSMGGLGI